MESRARDRQVVRNRDSRERWLEYTSHRQQVMRLLTEGASTTGRLLILGAGNCNDVDLGQLTSCYSEIHLVDLDQESLASGVARQGSFPVPRINLHGDVDVSGVAEWCCRWSPQSLPSSGEYLGAVQRARSHRWPLGTAPFDVAASIGLLSQLVEMVLLALGERTPAAWQLVAAVRTRHLQLLLDAVRPGGQVLLVTEVVSSATCPALLEARDEELDGLLADAIRRRNFFTGLNPLMLESVLRDSPDLAPQVGLVRREPPWLWNFGPRVYACTSLRIVRRE